MLLDQKNKSGLSYADIAVKVDMERSGVFKAVNFPSRTQITTYLKIAKALNYPEGSAVGEWRKDNLDKIKFSLHLPNKVYEFKAVFKAIKNKTTLTYLELSEKTELGKSTVEAIVHNPHKCSWDAVCRVLDLLKLDREEYYNPWRYSVYLEKEKNIDAAIQQSKKGRT